MANKPKLGSGGRFAALKRGGMSSALAAYVGRKKYGDKEMSKLAEAAQKKHNAHHKAK